MSEPVDENQEVVRLRNPSPAEIAAAEKASKQTVTAQKATQQHEPVAEEQSPSDLKEISPWEPAPRPFRLPSGAKVVIENVTPDGKIYVRRMGNKEESLFGKLKGGMSMIEVLEGVFDGTIKSRISARDLSFIDISALFIFIMSITYGSKMDFAGIIDCPACGPNATIKKKEKVISAIIDIVKDFEIKYLDDDFEYPMKVKMTTWPDSDITMNFGFPTVGNKTLFDDDRDIIEVIQDLVARINGTKSNGKQIEKKDWQDIICYMDQDDKQMIKDKLDNFATYGMNPVPKNIDCSCSTCPIQTKKSPMPEISLADIMQAVVKKISSKAENR